MPNRIDPAVNPMETPAFDTHRDHVPPQPAGDELSERDDPVLPLGDAGNAKVWCGAFFPHVGE